MSLLKRIFGDSSREISPAAAYRRLKNGEIMLLDVREPNEWRAGHAPGARHISLARLSTADLPAGRTMVTVCRSGVRSARAASQLRDRGVDVANMSGGMSAWARAGLPVVDSANKAGRVV